MTDFTDVADETDPTAEPANELAGTADGGSAGEPVGQPSEDAAPVREPVDPGDRPLLLGEDVLLIDRKRRRHLVTLRDGGEFHSHAGVLRHDEIIGSVEGSTYRTTLGQWLLAVRPTLNDIVLKMPRGAQVIYPKDLGPILIMADIQPGVRVLESGVGSGALSMAMLRAGAHITGYELREDFREVAIKNVTRFTPWAVDRYDVHIRDCYDGIDEEHLDRIVLDLPEPWQVVPHAEKALRPGGIIVAYTPTIGQAATFRHRLAESAFAFEETLEVLHRTWHIEGQSVRPDHRMVAHTGFLTSARLLAG